MSTRGRLDGHLASGDFDDRRISSGSHARLQEQCCGAPYGKRARALRGVVAMYSRRSPPSSEWTRCWYMCDGYMDGQEPIGQRQTITRWRKFVVLIAGEETATVQVSIRGRPRSPSGSVLGQYIFDRFFCDVCVMHSFSPVMIHNVRHGMNPLVLPTFRRSRSSLDETS